MYIYIYIYVNIHNFSHNKHACTRTCAFLGGHVYVRIHAYIYIYIYIHIYMHIQDSLLLSTHTHTHKTNTHTHSYIYCSHQRMTHLIFSSVITKTNTCSRVCIISYSSYSPCTLPCALPNSLSGTPQCSTSELQCTHYTLTASSYPHQPKSCRM